MEEKQMKTVNIDCAPGPIRPDAYFRVICEELGIEYFEPVTKFFGDWQWKLPELTEEQLKIYEEFVGDYLRGLYANGYVRYVSW